MKLDDKDKLIAELLKRISKLEKLVEAQAEKIKTLEARLKKNSKNSSKPPSSDGLNKPSPKPRSLRIKSDKKSGGQQGHKGHCLKQHDSPDEIINQAVIHCHNCENDLSGVNETHKISRQVFEIPTPSLHVTQYQSEVKICPYCKTKNIADFPDGINAPVQYGANIRAMILYFKYTQFLPNDRLVHTVKDLFNLSIARSTIDNISNLAHQNLEFFQNQVLKSIQSASIKHLDETGFRVEGKTHWLHVASNESVTYYHVNQKRKSLLDNLTGFVVHDHWKPYFQLENVKHLLCNAHHLRELNARIEDGERWAHQMKRWMLFALVLKQFYGRAGIPKIKQQRLLLIYNAIAERGIKFHESLPPLYSKRKLGRKANRDGYNLVIRLKNYQAETTRFIKKYEFPFTNNLAEQDIRMMKVQQKISGGFRSWLGADMFARIRSLISTAKKQSWNFFETLKQVVTETFIPDFQLE